jgi:hypothetical protein
MSSYFGKPTSPGRLLPLELELPSPAEAPSAEAVDLTEVPHEGAGPDFGMEIPESYGVDVVRALVQDPFHLLVYWELRSDSVRALADIFPDAAIGDFQPTMRLTDVDEGFEAYVPIPLRGKYWFGTAPDRGYRVDVGARSPQFGFVPIMRSDAVRTPRGTVAPNLDLDPDYHVGTPEFVRLLSATGFANDRVLNDLARADEDRGRDAGRFGAEVPDYLRRAFDRLPDEVRTAATAVAEGDSIDRDTVERLPDRLRGILLGLRDEDEVVTAAFMHLLPQLLRQALEGEFVEDEHHPLHLPPRFAIGSSEAIRRPRVDWRWMPSMTGSSEGGPKAGGPVGGE